MNSSKHDSDIATIQYKNAVLKAYGIVPVEVCFPGSFNSSVHLKRKQSTLQINHFALPQRRQTKKHKSGEEHSLSADETHFPLNMEQPSHGCRTEKERKRSAENDVLKAYGIIQDHVER